MRNIIWISAILISLNGYAQRNYLYGTVKDSSSDEWMIGVHIQNTTAGLITSTNPNGTFKIPAQSGDTLIISHIGYETTTYIVNSIVSEILEFHLKQQTVQLGEVQVTVFPEYIRFKEMILETELEEVFSIELPKLVAGFKPPTAQELHDPNLAPRAGISFNLDGITKKGKERKKLNKILKNASLRNAAYQKFSREWIASETQLSGDELTDFIEFCDFSVEYLSEATLFEIKVSMMELLADYHSNKTIDPNPGA